MSGPQYQLFVPDDATSLVPLRDLARELDITYWTVWNWSARGISGVKLRVCRNTSCLCTTKDEYNHFIRKVNDAAE